MICRTLQLHELADELPSDATYAGVGTARLPDGKFVSIIVVAKSSSEPAK